MVANCLSVCLSGLPASGSYCLPPPEPHSNRAQKGGKSREREEQLFLRGQKCLSKWAANQRITQSDSAVTGRQRRPLLDFHFHLPLQHPAADHWAAFCMWSVLFPFLPTARLWSRAKRRPARWIVFGVGVHWSGAAPLGRQRAGKRPSWPPHISPCPIPPEPPRRANSGQYVGHCRGRRNVVCCQNH